MLKLVSVVIATYNRARCPVRTIDSALQSSKASIRRSRARRLSPGDSHLRKTVMSARPETPCRRPLAGLQTKLAVDVGTRWIGFFSRN